MILYYVLFLNLQIFVGGSSFSCPSSIPTISYVSSCPKNKQEWETAANRKQCEAIKQNCTESVNFQYHCLLNQQLDGTLEVCAPAYFLQGFCASYNIQKKQIVETYNDGYECNKYHGSEQCPLRYKSSEAYKYQRCYPYMYGVKNETRTDTPLPATTETFRYEECRCNDKSWVGVVTGLLIVVVTIVIHILIWRYREAIWKMLFERERREEEGENNDEERNEEEQHLNPEVSHTVVPVNEDKIENLNNEIHSLKERLAKANKENEILKRRIAEQNDKNAKEERLKEVEQLRESHRIKEEELRDSLTKNEKIAEERLKEIQDLKETHTIKVKELQDSLSKDKSIAEEGLKEVQQLLEANRMKVEELQESLTRANEENEILKGKIDERPEVPVNDDEIEKLNKEIHSLKDSSNQVKNVAEERLKKNEQLRESHRIKEEELQNSVSKEKTIAEERLKNIQDLKETHRIKEEELQDSLKKEKKVVEELLKEVQRLKETHKKTEKEFQNTLSKEKKNGEEQLKEVRQQLRDTHVKIEDLEKRLAEAIRDNEISKRQIEEQRGVKSKAAPPRPTELPRTNEKEDRPVDEPKKSLKNKPAPPPPT